MDSSPFLTTEFAGGPLLQHRAWLERGIVHGFAGSAAGSSKEAFDLPDRLAHEFGASRALRLRQVHGSTICDVRSKLPGEFPEADGFIFRPAIAGSETVLLTIMTADCVPLIALGGGYGVLVHAGWRGIAAGIIERVVTHLDRPGTGPIEAVVGPCAGAERYEVGPEVVKAIGRNAEAKPASDGKHFLSLCGTVRNIIRTVNNEASVMSPGICTISRADFHSYRRDGNNAGRNVTFVLCSLEDR